MTEWYQHENGTLTELGSDNEPPHTIYLSGPMTGCKDDNRPAFNEAAEILRNDFRVLNPCDEDLTGESREVCMRRDYKMIDCCDEVRCLAGWTLSEGALSEIWYALQMGVPVFCYATGDSIDKESVLYWLAFLPDMEKKHTSGELAQETRDALGDGEFIIEDSGHRREFDGGAVRDRAEGKAQFYLIPPHALERVAQVFTKGAKKYDPWNWHKGMPYTEFLNSAERHMIAYKKGEVTEDHLGAACFNLLAIMQFEAEGRTDLDDRRKFGVR